MKRGHGKRKDVGPTGQYAVMSRRGAGMNTQAVSKENPLSQPDPVWIGRISARDGIGRCGAGFRRSRTLAENAGHVFSSGSPLWRTGAGLAGMVSAHVKEIAS